MNVPTTAGPYWPFWVYVAAVLALITGMMILSYLLGSRRISQNTGIPYESGVAPTGSAHVRISVNFYLMALFFVVFDLEAVFIAAWAVAARESGWPGYIGVLIFIVMLFAALVYLWKIGALDYIKRQRTTREEFPAGDGIRD